MVERFFPAEHIGLHVPRLRYLLMPPLPADAEITVSTDGSACDTCLNMMREVSNAAKSQQFVAQFMSAENLSGPSGYYQRIGINNDGRFGLHA